MLLPKSRLIRVALIMVSILFQFTLNGQTFYKILGSSNADETAQCVAATADGNYVIGGAKGDSALIIKVNPLGAVLWARCFKPVPNLPNVIYQIATTLDGHLVGTGNASPTGSLIGATFLFKFDLSGNVLWQTRSIDTRPIWTHRILPTSLTQYMMMSEVYDNTSPTVSDIYTGLINASTGILNSNTPRLNYISSNPYIDDLSCATIGISQSVYAGGRIYISGSDPGSMRAFITKFNPSGDHVWSKYLMFPESSSARIYGCDIIYSEDSLTSCYTGDINGASNSFSVGLIRSDTIGNVAWTKDYELQGYSSATAYKVLQMPYGYAITGYCDDGDRNLFVIAVTITGQTLWARTYGNNNTLEDILQPYTTQSVAIGSDILITGTNHSSGGLNIIIARVDSVGNIDCGNSSPVGITETSIPPYSLAITPTAYPDSISFAAQMPLATNYGINDPCSSTQLDLGPDTAICTPITLYATTPNASYSWSTGSTGPSIQVNAPGTVWVEVTMDCCTLTDTVVVSPGTLPTASFSVDTSTCGLSLSFSNTSSGSSSYLWNFGDGQTSSISQPTHVYDTAGTYSITLTATNGCGSQDTVVQVELIPAGTLSVVGPDSLCVFETASFSANLLNAVPVGIQWSTGDTTQNIAFSAPASTTLYVTATDSNACTYTDSLFLQIIPLPVAGFYFNALPCDTAVSFTDGSTNATQWLWDFGNGETSIMPSATGHYTPPGSYSIELVVANACGMDTSTQVLLLSGPTDTLSLIGPEHVCEGQGATFFAEMAGGTIASSIVWSTGTTDSISTLIFFDIEGEISVTVTGADGCIYADSLVVETDPAPIGIFTVTSNPCDSSAYFYNTSLNSDSFQWDFGNGATSNEASPTVQFNTIDSMIITLVASNACGTDTAEQLLSFDPLQQLLVEGPVRICSDAPIQVHISYAGISLTNIHWSTGDTTSTITVTPVNGDTITVSATNEQGCELASSFAVEYVGDDGAGAAYVPNVFTPNHDGINETFAPVIIDGFTSISIYNRWGKLIFEAQQITKTWHGDYHGKPVPDGTYVYVLKWKDACTGLNNDRIGHVTVLR